MKRKLTEKQYDMLDQIKRSNDQGYGMSYMILRMNLRVFNQLRSKGLVEERMTGYHITGTGRKAHYHYWPAHCSQCDKGIMKGTICQQCSMVNTLNQMSEKA
jgi:hypothetical protein